jgi:hypothetical protein
MGKTNRIPITERRKYVAVLTVRPRTEPNATVSPNDLAPRAKLNVNPGTNTVNTNATR